MYAVRNLHLVVSVDTQQVFDYVDIALYIHPIGGHPQGELALVLAHNLDFEAVQDALHRFGGDMLADKGIYLFISQCHGERRYGRRIDVDDVAADFAAGQLFHQHGSPFEGIEGIVRIDAPLEAERRIGIQSLTTGRLAHPRGVEAGRFEEYVGRLVGHARLQTAEHTGDTHGFLGVAYHQVTVCQRAFHLIERNELVALLGRFHNHLAAGDAVQVEAVERLPRAVQQVVGNIDHVVDGSQPDSRQTLLQPVGALGHLHVAHRHAAVSDTGLVILHLDSDAAILAIDGKALYRRTMQAAIVSVLGQIGCQVTSHAVVRCSIDAVGGNVDFENVVALDIVILFGGRTGFHRLGQHDDAIVRSADTDFVFGTNHAERLHAADFRFLDGKALVAAIQHGAQRGHYHILPSSDIGGAAHDLSRLGFAQVDGRNMQVVRIGVIYTGEHFADNQAVEASFYRLYLLDATGFEADGGKSSRKFLGSEVEVYIIFQPVIRNIHNEPILSSILSHSERAL